MAAAMTRKIMIGRYSRSITFIDRHPVRERTPSARPPALQKRRHYRAAGVSKKGQNEPIHESKIAWLQVESRIGKWRESGELSPLAPPRQAGALTNNNNAPR